MTHWGWYWKFKKKNKPKALCSSSQFDEIDSFKMFKNQELVGLVKESKDRICFMITQYDLIATLQDDNSLSVQFNNDSYVISVEKKSCNFGGSYYFFHCPQCQTRMRKLYCIQGKYLCRKCANLGYYSQRLRPSQRLAQMSYNVMDFLKSRAGSLTQKPPWMKKSTFQKLRIKYVKYDEKYFNAVNKELLEKYGEEGDFYFAPFDMFDAYVEREEQKLS